VEKSHTSLSAGSRSLDGERLGATVSDALGDSVTRLGDEDGMLDNLFVGIELG